MEYKMMADIFPDNFHILLEPCVGPVLKLLRLDSEIDRPINIVDFGTCQGRTSFPFLKILTEQIRIKSQCREIAVYLNDQKTNDFNALVRTITEFQEEVTDPFLRIIINPCNAYERCLPASSIDIGVCSLMVHWLSTPMRVEKQLVYLPSNTDKEEKIEEKAAQDWENFLSLRSREMKKGAVFLVVVLYYSRDLYEILCDEFYQLYERNIITKEELSNTTIPIYPYRTETELRAPFDDIGQQIGIQLLELRKRPVKFYKDEDVDCLRSWMNSSIMAGLCRTRNDEEANEISNIYFQNLKDRLSDWKWMDYFVFDVIFQKI
ncbi:uncharacterized protein LOC133199033 isoform X1 [Saccostrea echinata]|uniref:uncharacterized protein LOC133199033 isoform X1 n=1 Tax=Saccostrea echinata TaxID=191078 RepID=UPI002A838D89|nr:uncharacterized protein LOC133199033 isoform X1 [Saccostrea echinata]